MPKERLPHLDFLRGLAALAVCAGHLRGFMFVDWAEIHGPNQIDRLFYFATGLGHQAVVIFFVLSGFLVGGSTVTAWRAGKWSWRHYLLQRVVRLETVLLPALLLTGLLDLAGRSLTGGAGYDGVYYALLSMGPAPEAPMHIDVLTFVGNLAFLQTIAVPIFGTNGPLWSLANEFCYYIMFPLMLGLFGRFWKARAVSAALLLALMFWLPAQIILLGAIWVFGVLVALVAPMPRVCAAFRHPGALATSIAVFLATLLASKFGKWYGNDWAVGVGASLVVLAAVSRTSTNPIYRATSGRLADMSYTLYLFHFPLLAFFWFGFVAPRQFQPGVMAYSCYLAVLVGTLVYAYGLWWCFERNTDSIRNRVAARLFKRTLPPSVKSAG